MNPFICPIGKQNDSPDTQIYAAESQELFFSYIREIDAKAIKTILPMDINKKSNDFEYFLLREGQQFGPYKFEDLKGILDSNDMVWRQGIDWTEAKNLAEVGSLLRTESSNSASTEKPNNQDVKSGIHYETAEELYRTSQFEAARVEILKVVNPDTKTIDLLTKINAARAKGSKKNSLKIPFLILIIGAIMAFLFVTGRIKISNATDNNFNSEEASAPIPRQTTEQVPKITVAPTKSENQEIKPPFYIVNVAAVPTEQAALEQAQKLKQAGKPSGYLWIPNYASLSGARMYSVYIGPFVTQYECEVATEIIKKEKPGSYGLLVSHENMRVQINGIGDVTINNERTTGSQHPTKSLSTSVENLRLRQSPDFDSSVIVELPMGEALQYLGEKTDYLDVAKIKGQEIPGYWYRVSTSTGQQGWVHGCCINGL
jgi:hypothetical protein